MHVKGEVGAGRANCHLLPCVCTPVSKATRRVRESTRRGLCGESDPVPPTAAAPLEVAITISMRASATTFVARRSRTTSAVDFLEVAFAIVRAVLALC
jgi:hypothetical protein